MWRPWSSFLESLGRLRLSLFTFRRRVRVGDPQATDAQGLFGWRDYLAPERLFDVWGPHPQSPWVPFHCVPLFAALDRIKTNEIGPSRTNGNGAAGPSPLPLQARPGASAPGWLTPDTLTILDLPGPRSVEAAAWLIGSAKAQPVCTFDNWPNVKGVIRAEDTLAELLRWATTVAQDRPLLAPASPPLWICDNERLGRREPSSGQFDNRYYLDDSVLPGPVVLRMAGITRIVYVHMGATDLPLLDLEGYFSDLLRGGFSILHVDLLKADAEALPLSAPASPRKFRRTGYRRSAAGGFGTEVPEPSSGSSG
jgi:hypothetical protein